MALNSLFCADVPLSNYSPPPSSSSGTGRCAFDDEDVSVTWFITHI